MIKKAINTLKKLITAEVIMKYNFINFYLTLIMRVISLYIFNT